MTTQFRSIAWMAALLACAAPAFAQRAHQPKTAAGITSEKGARYERLRVLDRQMQELRSAGASEKDLAGLRAEFDKVSASLGGARPGRTASGAQAPAAHAMSGAQQLAPPTCGSAPTLTGNFPGTTGPITPPATFQGVSFTNTVSGLPTYLWDVNLNVAITHTWSDDLDITLTSPAGTTVVVSTDNAGGNDNVLNGTLFDETGLDTCTDHVYANNVVATPMTPEGRFQAFRGEDPNGVWTLTIIDDTNTDFGNLASWSLDVVTLAAAPVESTVSFTTSPGLAISASGTPTVTSTLAVSGANTYLTDVKVHVEITHTWNEDLDISLQGPNGTIVKLATDCGSGDLFDNGDDNGYNGADFDAQSTTAVTDLIFTDLVPIGTVSPEGSFGNFDGINPNGNWTLIVFDDTNFDGGTLVRWDISVTAASAQTPSAPTNFPGVGGPIPDNPGTGAVPTPTVYTTTVTGMGTYLWDADLTTGITHTANGDLAMTLTSPAGTTIVISTANADISDDVFNGTVWDDNAVDLAADFLYTSGVPVPTLAPEGRLSAFRGEDPNGVWTLTITDELDLDTGSLNSWSLDLATLTTPPTASPTTLTSSPGIVIDTTVAPFIATDSIVAAGLDPYTIEVEVYVEFPHTYAEDVNLTLTSPAGTTVVLTTLNGFGNDNVYNGTLFDPSVSDPVTDHVYTNNVVATPLSPEGGFDRFIGEDPNGTWTLTLNDPVTFDGGTLVRWDLTIRTCVGAGNAFCSNGTVGIDHATVCPCGNTGLPNNGCAHSFSSDGANLTATGSSAADTVQLHSTNEPATSFTLFLQHSAGGDTVFHDGVLCAGGTLIRLRGRAAVGGEAFFPNPAFPVQDSQTLSQRGATFPGSGATRRYSAWFRNASTTFCPPATANISNGWVITW